MTPTELIVCFKENISPASIIKANDVNISYNFERLYDISEATLTYKERNPIVSSEYKNEEDLFNEMVYVSLPDVEKRLYRTYIIYCKSPEEAAAFYEAFNKDSNVEFVEFDSPNEPHIHPNDPDLALSWGLAKIKCENAWNLSQGQGVVVAVLDSGVDYNHPDLKGSMWKDASGNCGKNILNNSYDPMDYFGHGTHVAGIIAATINNNIGSVGVAPKAQIMAVKVLGDDGRSSNDSVFARGIQYAVDNGAKVLNNSWGPSAPRSSNLILQTAIDYAHSKHVIVVFSAGNSDDDLNKYAPNNYSKVIAVAATTNSSTDKRWLSSNYGSTTISAPGEAIYSTLPNGQYQSYSGTLLWRHRM